MRSGTASRKTPMLVCSTSPLLVQATCWRSRSLTTASVSIRQRRCRPATASTTRVNDCARSTAIAPRSRSRRVRKAVQSRRSAYLIVNLDDCRAALRGCPLLKSKVWIPQSAATEGRPYNHPSGSLMMAKWKALIADDEPAARRGVRQLLAKFPEFTVVGECRNGAEVLAALENLGADVVFLDIQMPGIDGFEVIKRRTVERMPAVVFLTAFDQFAIKP